VSADVDRSVVMDACPGRLTVSLILERSVKGDVKRRQVIDADRRPVHAGPVHCANRTWKHSTQATI